MPQFLPLDEVYNLLKQPVTPQIRPSIYAEKKEQVETATITSQFFRDIAGQLMSFGDVRQQQEEAYRQRAAQREAQRQAQAQVQAQEQAVVDQATQDNLDRVDQLTAQQGQLEQLARQADDTGPIETPADEALVEEAAGNSGFFSGLMDLGEGAFDLARGATGVVAGPIEELIETPFEVGREIITGGGIGGIKRELKEGVAPISEPIEAAIEIARASIRGDLQALRAELAEAGREIPQAQDLVRAWSGLNQIFLGEQKIITPFTRPIIRETLEAFHVPEGIAETIAKYAAEILVPTTFIPIYGQLGKTRGAAKLLKVGMAEGVINMLQNKAGRKDRDEEEPDLLEDVTMFTFGFGGRIGMEYAVRGLSKFLKTPAGQVVATGARKVSSAIATPFRAAKQAGKAVGEKILDTSEVGALRVGEVADEVTIYHGTGGAIEGDSLKSGSFVTTDRAAAQKYAQVDARVREVQGQPVQETVYEARVPRSALAEAPEDATTLGSPFILRADTKVTPSKVIEEVTEAVTEAVPAPEKTLRLEHYSAEQRDIIKPSKAGTAQAGAEMDVGGPPVSHFYMEGAKPERIITGKAKMTVEVPESRILDLASEEGLALSARVKTAKTGGVAVNMGDVRQAAMDEGWIGTYNSTDPLRRVQMFEDTVPLKPSVFEDAVIATKANNGVTVDAQTGKALPYKDYFVGGGAPTKTVPFDEFKTSMLDDFVAANPDVYAKGDVKVGGKTVRVAVGTEVVEEAGKKVVNIDATIPVKGREEALELARERGEQRVWDTQANKAIDVEAPKPKLAPEAKPAKVAITLKPSETKKALATLDDWTPSPKDIDTMERQVLKSGVVRVGETPAKRAERVKTLIDAEWNHKIAASTFLETGKVPKEIVGREAREQVKHIASVYQRQFLDHTLSSDIGGLTRMKKKGRLTPWQQKIVDESLEARKVDIRTPVDDFKALPKAERTRLNNLGWDHVQQTPTELRRVQSSLLALDRVDTVPALTKWLKRNVDIVGDVQDWIGRKAPRSPYWEPKPFYEAGYRLNIPRIKAAIRARYPDQRFVDGTKQTISDALRINKRDPLGPCG